MTQRSLLLVNPHARRGLLAQRQAVQILQPLGFELIEVSAASPQDLSDSIRRYKTEVDSVIIASGDGTINAAIEGLLETQLPLGILPVGTANNLARSVGIPSALPEACAIIARGHLRSIDLGWVNGKYFFNVAGIGISGEINRTVSKRFKRHFGVLAYAFTAMQVLLRSRPFRAKIRTPTQTYSVKTIQITICNGRYYGSGLVVAEDAQIDDQRLDLYCIEIRHWWEMLRVLPAMLRGKTAQGIHTLQGQDIEIVTRKPRPIDTDGELTTHTPASFRVLPHALRVFVPVPRD
jgi:YegS/Rv2252/BmrU family lipid kinase